MSTARFILIDTNKILIKYAVIVAERKVRTYEENDPLKIELPSIIIRTGEPGLESRSCATLGHVQSRKQIAD